jgi:murein DD-endopeptidase MepM/ murein hydrolase activator NlpD
MAAIPLSLRMVPAGLACLLAGLMLATVLHIALRRWPALAARRVVWLGGQAVLAAVFFVSLIPQTARLSLLPAVVMARPAQQVATVVRDIGFDIASNIASDAGPAQTTPIGPAQPPGPRPSVSAADPVERPAHAFDDILPWLPLICLLAYCAGLMWKLLALIRGRKILHALFGAAEPLSASQLAQHDAFGAADIAELKRHSLTVWETDAAISPMLTGLFNPRLLLPRHLRGFSEEQQQLIVLHELTHWRRRDPFYQAIGQALRIVLWFNPVMPWLGRKLNWAQELACDGQVLAGRPQRERLSYAAALVGQLKFQAAAASDVMPGLAFGGAMGDAMAARIKLMRQTGVARVGAAGKGLLAAAVGLVVAASVLLQPAFAWSPAPAAPTAMAASAAPARPWTYPLDKIKVTSFYGVVSKILPNGHHGIDLAAKKGTPIYAVAAGTVTVGNDAHYGNFIAIDHDRHWRSLYAHLDAAGVHTGQIVAAGQAIGKVGQTGMATGPHLHVEVWHDGHLVDPQTMLAGLDERATARALSVRKAQLGH